MSRGACAATPPTAAASPRSAPTRCAAASRSRATGCCARCRPTDADPFGTTLRPQRSLEGTPPPLQPIADDPATGLLTGVAELPGFTALEESEPAERVRVALAVIDQAALDEAEAAGEELPPSYPALALSDVGEGIVIRVGLPEWGARLKQGSVPVQQLTRNIADILRGAEPEIRTF